MVICSRKTDKGVRCKRVCVDKYCWQHKEENRCDKILREKIRENMKEFKEGRLSSQKQAIAVSYSQVIAMDKKCAKRFSRK